MLKKEIEVKQVSDEETNFNLQMEEEIVGATKKESKFKALLLSITVIIGVLGCVYAVVATLIPNVSLEDIRVDNFRKANSYVELNKKNLLQAEKMVEIYEKRIEQGNWCLSANSEKGVAKDCFIFNK